MHSRGKLSLRIKKSHSILIMEKVLIYRPSTAIPNALPSTDRFSFPCLWHTAAAWQRTMQKQLCKKLRMPLPTWNPLMTWRRKEARSHAGTWLRGEVTCSLLQFSQQQPFSQLILQHSLLSSFSYSTHKDLLPTSKAEGVVCLLLGYHRT